VFSAPNNALITYDSKRLAGLVSPSPSGVVGSTLAAPPRMNSAETISPQAFRGVQRALAKVILPTIRFSKAFEVGQTLCAFGGILSPETTPYQATLLTLCEKRKATV